MLEPFPFTREVEAVFKLRRVSRQEIAAKGIARAYRDTPEEECRIRLTGRPEEESAGA
ncbi:hypothetical protein D3C72_2527500 [compost metagenome]